MSMYMVFFSGVVPKDQRITGSMKIMAKNKKSAEQIFEDFKTDQRVWSGFEIIKIKKLWNFPF